MNKTEARNRKIVFQNGREFLGSGFGADVDCVCNSAFDTAMIGYQEIVTDPACAGQALIMTYPIIGTYGMADEDYESRVPRISCLVVRQYNDHPSNFRFTKTLGDVLVENNIPAIQGVDTRAITRMLRNEGSQKMIITSAETSHAEAMQILEKTDLPTNLVQRVSSRKTWYSRTPNFEYNIVAIDCGIRASSIRCLTARGCNVTIVPFDSSAETILALKPDGLFVSSGPGNPKDAPQTIELIRNLRGKAPIFGMGIGCQLIALAFGGDTYKMRHPHSGANVPVSREGHLKREITAQAHAFAIDEKSLEKTGLIATHHHLLDNSVEAILSERELVLGVQYSPENDPGANDCVYHYDTFIEYISKGGKK